jgi:hypothetical protein
LRSRMEGWCCGVLWGGKGEYVPTVKNNGHHPHRAQSIKPAPQSGAGFFMTHYTQ